MWMEKSASIERWNHTAKLLAMLERGPSGKNVEPWQFHPHGKAVKPPIVKVGIECLKVFVK